MVIIVAVRLDDHLTCSSNYWQRGNQRESEGIRGHPHSNLAALGGSLHTSHLEHPSPVSVAHPHKYIELRALRVDLEERDLNLLRDAPRCEHGREGVDLHIHRQGALGEEMRSRRREGHPPFRSLEVRVERRVTGEMGDDGQGGRSARRASEGERQRRHTRLQRCLVKVSAEKFVPN